MRWILLALVVALPATAGEYAVLASGLRLHADRHETTDGEVRLYSGQGSIELPADQVQRFEADGYAPPRVTPAPAQQLPEPSARAMVTRAALRQGLPPALVHSVAAVESGYRKDAVSPKGAIGIMQLMPRTARELQADPRNPEQNADAGAKYLRDLLLKYQNDPFQLRKALAGYNAGPASVDRYKGVPPYRETIQYVEKVISLYNELKKRTP
jgi:soluble lytic murein transglycosylase-like protein